MDKGRADLGEMAGAEREPFVLTGEGAPVDFPPPPPAASAAKAKAPSPHRGTRIQPSPPPMAEDGPIVGGEGEGEMEAGGTLEGIKSALLDESRQLSQLQGKVQQQQASVGSTRHRLEVDFKQRWQRERTKILQEKDQRLQTELKKEFLQLSEALEHNAREKAKQIEADFDERMVTHQQKWRQQEEDALSKLADTWGRSEGLYSTDLARSVQTYTEKVDALLASHHREQLALWEKEQTLAMHKLQQIDQHYLSVEQSVLSKYRQLLDATQAAHEEEKQRLIKHMEQQTQQQATLVGEEVRRVHYERVHFEQELQRRCAAHIEAMREEQDRAANDRLGQLIKTLDEKAASERRRAEAHVESLYELEQKTCFKYEKELEGLRQDWDRLQTEATTRIDSQLEEHYTNQLQQLKQEFDEASAISEQTDRRWVTELQQLSQQQLTALQSFEQGTRLRYEQELHKIKHHHDAQCRSYESELQRVQRLWGEEKDALLAKIRKLKMALAKWRIDYQQAAQQHYDEAVGEMEDACAAKVERLSQHIHQQRQHDERELMTESRSAHEARGGAAVGGGSMSATWPELRATLQSLWETLDVPRDEILDFVLRCERVMPYTPQLQNVYESECRQLSNRLPLFRRITQRQQRQQLQQRLQTLVAAPPDHPHEPAAATATTNGADIEQTIGQLSELDDVLMGELTEFEERHGVPFTYQGQPYLQRMRDEAREALYRQSGPPESPAAGGGGGGSVGGDGVVNGYVGPSESEGREGEG
ncbi:unnamed protein product [Vitrella brassicaformis CCMP3155]|uniref:Uncharacterized protein n=1 Tax=Vitrella brassicaformis (strain CCMP3155) TaxID=1169540 RepID=A0A0G4EH91_VITBC|nr:unnamed protein product [Vitrella brassicaformis CCMP3155]|eukprot:CEL95390.1 unnamed protein product [Vitrella brassicaformis CCMP3155]